MSVKLTTPASLPAMFAPGSADAETEGVLLRGMNGGLDCGREKWVGGWGTEGWESWLGLVVVEEEGEEESVTHILLRVSLHECRRQVYRGFLPVGFCSDELGNGVRERGVRVDMENGEGIFAIVHASS